MRLYVRSLKEESQNQNPSASREEVPEQEATFSPAHLVLLNRQIVGQVALTV
jgi:hypothetical protein